MSTRFDDLKALLRTLFQLDQPDLDFGIYRIMHAKADEITRFLDKDLLPQVREAFEHYQPADKAALQKQLDAAIASAEELGVDPESTDKVKSLRSAIANDSVDINALEAQVYDHLYSFFRRYYSEGDFLSQRVYKPGVYAIPYEGEEVKLHWANADQYYIKTSEYLRDYAFRLKPDGAKNPMRVHFRLVDAAEGEHGNIKAAEGKNRVFILTAEDPVAIENAELVARFEYRPATMNDWTPESKADATKAAAKKPPDQKTLLAIAAKRLLAAEGTDLAPWLAELDKPHVKADGKKADYNRLEAHLNRYFKRNQFDYFIHKDLGGFLRREIDFYIKNEIMRLDDIEDESAPKVEQYLSKIRVVRKIAHKLIDFLAQLEDFQKKLWLKKKFVTETFYCVRVGVIPEEFHNEIAACDAQRREWVDMLKIDTIEDDLTGTGYTDPLTPAFLTAHPTLMIDTRHFDEAFVARLLDAMGDLDEKTDGLLFNSENYQALRVIQPAMANQVQCICIDPPYNTGDDGFAYKDQYQRSSWITFLSNRLLAGSSLLCEQGAAFVNIDDNEFKHLWHIMSQTFGESNYLGSMVWKRRSASAMSSRPLSLDHEYVLAFGCDSRSTVLHGLAKSEEDYPHIDDATGRHYASTDLTIGMTREQRPNQFYDIVNPRTGVVYSPNPNRVWRFFPETMAQVVASDLIIWPDESEGDLERPRYKTYYNPESMRATPCSSWIETASTNDREIEQEESDFELSILKSGMNSEGGRILDNIFGSRTFAYPKPISLIRSIMRASTRNRDIVMDFFAGSGTTGHAVVDLNREDGGRRRIVLVEMGAYFDSVLLIRLKKIVFAPDWRDGQPSSHASAEQAARSPQLLKVVRLESYDDTLNNLDIVKPADAEPLLNAARKDAASDLAEQYTLRYMLDVETRGSQSLLNIRDFVDPAAYSLNVKAAGSDVSREVCVDLLETFNWLIGLKVHHLAAPEAFEATTKRDQEKRLTLDGRLRTVDPKTDNAWWFRTVTGTAPGGEIVLVIWRKQPATIARGPEGAEEDNLILNEWFKKKNLSTKDFEYDLIYVNGDSNLENLKRPDDTWKVRLIEEDFHRLMFDEGGL